MNHFYVLPKLHNNEKLLFRRNQMGFIKFLGLTIVGGVVIGGLAFTGTETLASVSNQLQDLKTKIVTYEENENSLLNKISLIKEDANSKISTSATRISELTTRNNDLTNQINGLNVTIVDLQSQIITLTDSGKNNGQMIKKLKEDLAIANVELERLRNELSNSENQLSQLTNEKDLYKSEAERANKEIEKANEAVNALRMVSEEVAEETNHAEPLTASELDAIETTVGE